MLERIGPRYLTLIVLAAVVVVLPLVFPSSYYFRVAALVWVSALAAVGLNVLMGQAGRSASAPPASSGSAPMRLPSAPPISACRHGRRS